MRPFPETVSHPHILVVDDDPDMLRSLTVLLESCGYTVAVAEDGSSALQQLASDRKTDVVLTDLYMPNTDGLELILALREAQGALPIVAMSGGGSRSGHDTLSMARKLGANAVIDKPFRKPQIVETIDRVLAATARS